MQRILTGASATLSWQPLGADGEAAAPAGAVTVGVTRDDGTAVIAAGTATAGAGSDPRTVVLPAASNDRLDLLTATWTDTGDGSTHVTKIQVVGGFYFTLVEARASDSTLANATRYPNTLLTEVRAEVEDEFEGICRRSFVPRFRRITLKGNGISEIRLDRLDVRAVKRVKVLHGTSSTVWTTTQIANMGVDPSGMIVSRDGSVFTAGEDIEVSFEHGMDSPPWEIKRAALTRLRHRANVALTAIPDRATRFAVSEGGTYALDTAGEHKTGIPDVDAVLARWGRPTPLVA